MTVAIAVGHELGRALSFAFGMTWEVLWALILGFALSGAVQAVVSKRELRRLLPDDSPKTLAIASGLGAASSSCSYASVALARSLFRKGADFTAAMSFQFASTNLVIELGIIMALLLGWQFVLGEFVGGPLMIATSGPISGPQNLASVWWCSKKSRCQNELGTQAASAPAISRPPKMSRATAAQSITK